MKKLIIILVSAFSFCTIVTLGLIAIFSNVWGITIDHDGLFPEIQITATDYTLSDFENSTYAEAPTVDKDAKYYIKNNTGSDISLEIAATIYDEKGTDYNIYLNSMGGYLVSFKNNVFTVSLVDNPDDYDYYFANRFLQTTPDNNWLYLNIDKYFEGSSYPDQNRMTDRTVTIKDGEQYEIKLP